MAASLDQRAVSSDGVQPTLRQGPRPGGLASPRHQKLRVNDARQRERSRPKRFECRRGRPTSMGREHAAGRSLAGNGGMFEQRRHVLRCSAGAGREGSAPERVRKPSHSPQQRASPTRLQAGPPGAAIRFALASPSTVTAARLRCGRSSARMNEPRTPDDPMSSVARRPDRRRIARVRKRNFTAHAARTRPGRHTPWRCKTERIRKSTFMRTVPVDGTGQSEAMSGEVCMDRARASGTVGAQGPTHRQGNGRHCRCDLRPLRRSRHTGSGGGPPSGRTPP